MELALLDTIRRSRRRVLVGRLVGWLADGLVFGLLAAVAFGAWASAWGAGAAGWPAFWICLGLLLGAYLVRELTRGTSLEAVAIRLDRELGFHDRLSSALVFSRQAEPSGFMRAHLEETAEFLRSREREAVAVPWPRRGRAFGLFIALALVSLLPHADRSLIAARDRVERQAARARAGQDLVGHLKDLRQRADLAGLDPLSAAVAEVEQALAEELKLVEPEDLAPPPQPAPPASDQPVNRTGPEPADDGLKRGEGPAAGGVAGDGLKLSQVASYQPTGKFDSFPAQSYAEVFAEIDDVVIGDDFLTAEELRNLATQVSDTAGKIGNFGYFQDGDATLPQAGPAPQFGQLPEDEQRDEFRSGLAPLQYKAFSEFLKRYSAHLGEKALGRAHFEQSGQRTSLGGEVVNVSAPPPKDAAFSLQGVSDQAAGPLLEGTPEQLAQVAAQTLAQGQITGADGSTSGLKVQGGGTAPGGQGAGMGGGSGPRAAAPKILPRASGGEYLPLEGKLSDGESVVRLIDAAGHRRLGPAAGGGQTELTYREVFVEYARGAEAELNGEEVPLHMRDFIRDYFRAIRPEAR